jgi:two-component system nitrate/nitrite response regulator NarL
MVWFRDQPTLGNRMKSTQIRSTSLTSIKVSAKASAALRNASPDSLAQPLPLLARKPHSLSTGKTTKANRRVRLLVADDHPVVRRGISACLARHKHLVIVGEAADGLDAVTKAKELSPDMVLLDIDLPKMSGLAVTEVLRKELPQIKVLILSMHQHSEYLLRLLQSGAQGYVLKEASSEVLVEALERVNAGETFYSPEITRLALNQFVQGNGHGPDLGGLTNREREVLTLVAEGLSSKDIADHLEVGVRTIETHRERIMRKLAVHTVAGLTRFAVAKGLITLRDEPPR